MTMGATPGRTWRNSPGGLVQHPDREEAPAEAGSSGPFTRIRLRRAGKLWRWGSPSADQPEHRGASESARSRSQPRLHEWLLARRADNEPARIRAWPLVVRRFVLRRGPCHTSNRTPKKRVRLLQPRCQITEASRHPGSEASMIVTPHPCSGRRQQGSDGRSLTLSAIKQRLFDGNNAA